MSPAGGGWGGGLTTIAAPFKEHFYNATLFHAN